MLFTNFVEHKFSEVARSPRFCYLGYKAGSWESTLPEEHSDDATGLIKALDIKKGGLRV